jgi:predicted nucleic acid-binding protein
MQPSPSRLDDSHSRLVIDASGVINLLGTGSIDDVLATLGREVHVERRAYNEIIMDPFTRKPAADTLAAMARDRIRVSDLPIGRIAEFVAFASAGTDNGLDDGEAATVVLALHLNAVAVLDEERATRAAAQRYPHVTVLSSLDLLWAPPLLKRLGGARVSDLIFAACKHARMRIPASRSEWVVSLLGSRAQECSSIRKYYRKLPAA